MIRWLSLAGVLWLTLLGQAQGQNIRQVRAGDCIARLATESGLAGGIATPGLAKQAFVRRCDDSWFQIGLQGESLALLGLNDAPSIFVPDQPADPEMLPDGEVTAGFGDIESAWLVGPTDIYGHGILGDRIEATGFRVLRRDGTRLRYRLDGDSVYEDLRVRLVDLSGDDEPELVLIRSYLNHGGALAVYGLTADGIEPLGESPWIGRAYRWLNPAGAADFDGDGRVEIGYVETPHIGGTLRMFQLGAGGLTEEYAAFGFSNHVIGSRVLDMSAVLDWNADGIPDLALPDASRTRMLVVTVARGTVTALATIPGDREIATAVLATDLDGDDRPELVYGLRDGTVVLARP